MLYILNFKRVPMSLTVVFVSDGICSFVMVFGVMEIFPDRNWRDLNEDDQIYVLVIIVACA